MPNFYNGVTLAPDEIISSDLQKPVEELSKHVEYGYPGAIGCCIHIVSNRDFIQAITTFPPRKVQIKHIQIMELDDVCFVYVRKILYPDTMNFDSYPLDEDTGKRYHEVCKLRVSDVPAIPTMFITQDDDLIRGFGIVPAHEMN